MTAVHLSIIVYKGSPLDYPQYRHTALWLRFGDGSPPHLVHVVGPPGGFVFESGESDKPWETQGFAKMVEVGRLLVSATPVQTVQALRRVPIVNSDREFNCQTWVEAALKTFKVAGHLSADSYERGVDGMVDAIDEAEYVDE
ncbi:uncharacterized protein RCC_00215 [Ramularia collo-cygni]|uniref:Uncharacterized protein n=1 Tax=Ramularia collo-cygni TaxID=112498 RepID=A0A2D3UQ75_9PEZI|nr:uncharacterized protein RCC_00215 [Ramularia collo-cygni]CZT14240.1 uncharacterized protein RCC_00215 [Ramularia collo-cygni]